MAKYSTYTASFKLKVIAFAEECGIRAAGRKFNIPEFNVRYWSKQKDALQKTKMSTKSFRGPKTGRFPRIEEELLVYVRTMRNCGASHDMMLSKAREIARSQGIDGSRFKVSRGWLGGFMRRHGLSLRQGHFLELESSEGHPRVVDNGAVAFHNFGILRQCQSKMLVMETEQHIKETSSSLKGTPVKSASAEEVEEAEIEAAVVEEEVEEEEELGEEEEEKLLAASIEEENTLHEEDLEACVEKEVVVVEEPGTPGLSELVTEVEEEEEEEECGEPQKVDEEAGASKNMLVEVVSGHGMEGGCMGKEGSEGEDIVSKEKDISPQTEVKDSEGLRSEVNSDGGKGRTKDANKDGSIFKVAGQLISKESPEVSPEKKNNGQSKETFSCSKVKKEPKETTDDTQKTVTSSVVCKGTSVVSGEQENESVTVVKLEPPEEAEESPSKVTIRGAKGDMDSSNPASDDYEEEGQEDGAEETPEEGSHGEKRSCLEDSGGVSSEESGEFSCKRRRVEGGSEGGSGGRVGSHHRGEGGEESKECLLARESEKEGGGGADESLDRKMDRLRKEIHMLGMMAKQKEAEWDEIIRAKKVKEETLLRLRRRRRIAAIGREVSMAERRRHRRRARTEANISSEEEGTDEEWYMQIRGMTGGALPPSRTHAGGGSGQRGASGRAPARSTSVNPGFLMGMNSSPLSHTTAVQSLPMSTSSVPSIVSSTYSQRMHRPILPKPPTIPSGSMNRRNVMQQSSPVTVATTVTSPLLPTTIPSNGGLSGNGCSGLDGSQNVNQVIGEGRQGPILDVRSIIADYRSRHPETVPLRGRRNKSLTPSPAAATSSREGASMGGGSSDGGPSDIPGLPEGAIPSVANAPGILNIASLALGSGSQVRTRGLQTQDGNSSDISYLLLSAGNGCPPGGPLPVRHQQPGRDSSRPSSTESSRSGGHPIPPVSLPAGALVDSSGNFSFKDVLVQFARMSQTEQQQQMMAVIPGMASQGLLSAAPPLQSQASVQSRQPRQILPSTTTTSVLPGPLVTPARPPPPPYPEVTLLPVLVSGNEGSSIRPNMPPDVSTPQQRANLPPPTPSLLQMSLSAPTSAPQVSSPPSTSLLHGILTKSGTGVASSSGLGSSSGPSPRATAFAPTLARLLTAPEKQPSLSSVRPAPPPTTGTSVLGSQAFVSIGELLQTSKAKNEITITPVSGAPTSVLKQQQQQQPCITRPTKEEPAAHMEEEQDDSTDRLVIDESITTEPDGRRQPRQRPAPVVAPGMTPEVQESIADEEVEEEEVAMEEEDGMEEEGAMEDEEEEGEEGPVPECQGCHNRAAQFVCAGCGNQWYCSRDCQVSAWDEHSEVCSG